MRTTTSLLAATLLLAGCAATSVEVTGDDEPVITTTLAGDVSTELVEQALAIEVPASYVVEWEAMCFCPVTHTRVTVVDGEVTAREALEDGTVVGEAQAFVAPTLTEVLGRLAEVSADDDGVVTDLELDGDGMLVFVRFDPVANAVDDEVGYRVLAFEAGG